MSVAPHEQGAVHSLTAENLPRNITDVSPRLLQIAAF